MLSKNDAIKTLQGIMTETQDDHRIEKIEGYILKIEGISEEQFAEIATRSLGENAGVQDFINWVDNRLNHELVGTGFIELNDMVSYNIAGSKQDTIALHVIPEHVSTTDIRNMGPYLVDALEQLSMQIESGEIEGVENVFAVSHILRIKKLQDGFRELGFEVGKADEAFQEHFKNPYQANLKVATMLSDEWKELKEEFKSRQPQIDVYANAKKNQEAPAEQDQSDDNEDR